MPAERMYQLGTVTIRQAREATCKGVESLHMQGALALEEIGPEHRQIHYGYTQLRPYHGGDDLTWYKGLSKGLVEEYHVPQE